MSDALPTWTDSLECAALSDIGLRRTNNQDSFIVLRAEDETTWLNRGHMFVVADGMGAHAAGELASKLAADGVVHHYRKLRQLSPPEALLRAVRDTNAEIHQRGQANAEFHNMGTTCSILLLLPQGALVAHVGDSRVYHVRGRLTEQLTFDHSLVWEMRAASSGLSDSAALNIPKNVITRSLGPQPYVQVDLEGPFEVRPGDTFLLCSDGLTGRVDDRELGLIVSLLPPNDSAQFLVDLANSRGGPDNITVIVVRTKEPTPTSHAWRGEPLVVGQDLRPIQVVHPLIWITIALGLVIGAGLAILQFYLLASLAVAAAGVAGLVPWWQARPRSAGIPLTGGRRLGRGPYVNIDNGTLQYDLGQLCTRIGQSLEEFDSLKAEDRARARACLDDAQAKLNQNDVVAAMRMLAVSLRVLRGG